MVWASNPGRWPGLGWIAPFGAQQPAAQTGSFLACGCYSDSRFRAQGETANR
jgi:hypothetical protein